MKNLFSSFLVSNPRISIGSHHSFASVRTHAATEISFPGRTHAALPTEGLVARNDRIPGFAGRHPFSYGFNDAGCFVA